MAWRWLWVRGVCLQARGPEFKSLHPWKLTMAECACNPSTESVETGRKELGDQTA